jgi:hypothetical protein
MIVVDNLDLTFIPLENRENGISGILKVKNGEDYLKLTIESVINQLDELIIIYSESNDKTEEILLEIELKYNKVKLYKCVIDVKLVELNNFLLSKTTKKFIIKIDDDNLYFPNIINQMKNKVENTNIIGVKGINIYDYQEELYIIDNLIFTSSGNNLMFKYNEKCYYVEINNNIILKHNYNPIVSSITGYYHLKFCKRNRGYNKLTKNSKFSISLDNLMNINNKLKLLDKKLLKKLNVKILPTDIGFFFINNSNKI